MVSQQPGWWSDISSRSADDSAVLDKHVRNLNRRGKQTAGIASQIENQPLRVFCPIWKDPYITINRATYVHDMLRVCGGDNIFAQRQRRFPLAADLRQEAPTSTNRTVERDRRYPRVSLDEMASRRPDIILLPDEPYMFTEFDRDDFLSFNDVPAVQQQRIYLIDGKIISWYGTRIGESLRTLQKRLLY